MMAGKAEKPPHGGPRPNSGAPRQAVMVESDDFDTDDPVAFLKASMRDKSIDFRLRQEAAVKLLAHQKRSKKEVGKKGEQADAASEVAKGKFAPIAPPKLVAVK
jgi:phage terminase small subunit